jgi:molybdopterin molybdotransferase
VAAFERARDSDILVTIGGASVGDHDLVQTSLRQCGFVSAFWRIAVRPSKPLMFGRIGSLPVLSLPGNPVSAMACALLFLWPAMQKMLGARLTIPAFEKVELGVAMAANDTREDYVRARLERCEAGQLVVWPFPIQDSFMQTMLAQADALIRRTPFAPPAPAGEPVDVLRFDCLMENF